MSDCTMTVDFSHMGDDDGEGGSWIVLPRIDGVISVIPSLLITQLIYGEIKPSDIDDGDMLVRSILARYLEILRPEADE